MNALQTFSYTLLLVLSQLIHLIQNPHLLILAAYRPNGIKRRAVKLAEGTISRLWVVYWLPRSLWKITGDCGRYCQSARWKAVQTS